MKRCILQVACFVLLTLPAAAQGIIEQTENSYRFDLSGRTIAVVMSDDVEINEAVAIPGYWKKWGARIVYVGTAIDLPAEETVVGAKGFGSVERRMPADVLLDQFKPASVDLIYFPGGGSPESLLQRHREKVIALVAGANRRGQVLAAFCGGPEVLVAADVVRNRRIASEVPPSAVRAAGGIPVVAPAVEDGNLVTGSFPYAESFAVAVATKLSGRRETDAAANTLAVGAQFAVGIANTFETREVPDSLIRDVVQAAMLTPFDFPMNLYKPWEVVAVKNGALRQRVRVALSTTLETFYEKAGMPPAARARWIGARIDAPAYLVVTMKRRPMDGRMGPIEPGAEVALRHQTLAAGAFVNNLRVTADKAGLGAHLMAGMPFLLAEADLAAALELPADGFITAVVALGYPAARTLPQPMRPLGENLTIR